jgi:hypothetical protein
LAAIAWRDGYTVVDFTDLAESQIDRLQCFGHRQTH